jgi:phosphatidylethanolamine/phosphatidyl-N-methylethanolamine N-methyltransferase
MAGPDVLSFFRALRADPRTVGAVAPSSLALAEAITREITVASAPVIELGPGTGVFTKALLDRGLCETDLTLVECGSDFARLLQVRFPAARVLWMDAARLDRHPLFEATPVGAVVSGLPLLNMTPRKVISILTGAFSYVRPGGAMYQFTYGPRCPMPRPLLDRLGLRARGSSVCCATFRRRRSTGSPGGRRPSSRGSDCGMRMTAWSAMALI